MRKVLAESGFDPPTDQRPEPAATAELTTSVDAALADIRAVVAAQTSGGVLTAPPTPGGSVVRFSETLPATLEPDDRARLVAQSDALAPWLQGPFLLGGDVVVGGAWRSDRRWEVLGPEIGDRLAGRRVLDVGSNAGYDAFTFKLRGADDVVACEPYGFHQQAVFLESLYQSGVHFENIGWQSLTAETHGTFDLIHCNGVLYHEAHPMALLQALRPLLRDDGVLLLGTMMLSDPEVSEYIRFVPGCFANDPSWWMVPGRLAVRWMLQASGFTVHYEFGHYEWPAGEFAVVNGYLRCTAGTPAPQLSSARD